MSEDALLTGPLEATNEPYAIAKIAASNVRKLSCPIRLRLHLGDADEPSTARETTITPEHSQRRRRA